jgi:hypothetical protein
VVDQLPAASTGAVPRVSHVLDFIMTTVFGVPVPVMIGVESDMVDPERGDTTTGARRELNIPSVTAPFGSVTV